MGRRCVVAGCGNTAADGVSCHTFPKNEHEKQIWTRFVKLTRSDYTAPTKHHAICSAHFTENCYDVKYKFKADMGLQNERCKYLKPGSFPSIYPSTQLNEAFLSSPSPAKKPRKAVAKREVARILNEYNSNCMVPDCEEILLPESDMEKENDPPENIVEDLDPGTTDASCQTQAYKPKMRSAKVQTSLKQKEAGTQVKLRPRYRSVGIQTGESFVAVKAPLPVEIQMENVDDTGSEQLDSSDGSGYSRQSDISVYQPSSDESSESDASSIFQNTSSETTVNERKFIVCESKLLELFNLCPMCKEYTVGEIFQVFGSLVKIGVNCGFCGHSYTWNSQNFIGSIPAGNLAMSASVLFTGSVAAKALRIFEFMNVPCVGRSTFMEHQKHFLFPAIENLWKTDQLEMIRSATEGGSSLIVAGDGRADTPGHSAKYGSYSLLDLEEGVILDVQIVQSNEVKSSNHMEKEGLIRSVEWAKEKQLNIATIITDRHLQIQKWIRENMKETTHYYDVWHVAKGLKKKLVKLSNEKDCDQVKVWIKSILNHLYWCAASTPSGDGDLMWAKWESITNHVQNIHSNHPNEKFPRCLHKKLVGRERRKKWLKPGTKACEKLVDLLTSAQLKRDVRKLSPYFQTSELEAYHSTVNHFAPKMTGFSFHGMYCR